MSMREEYQALMEKQLAEWKIQAERFKVGAQQLETQAKVHFDKNLELLRSKQVEAWDHFQKLKAAHEGTWVQTRAHLENAGEEIKAAVEQLTKSSKGK